ncbi:MAG: TrmB family transcriptional regulator [Deltaproteobacteria bacterium]|nr:TrmB family transcriptional regulator [Deltaproteobacteria bacterium]
MPRKPALEERIVAAMQSLGFTASDARIYLALLKRHPATGYELAAGSGVPRSAIYNVLGRRERRGLVQAVQRRPARYRPLPPERLLSQLEAGFREGLEELRTGLAGLSRPAADGRTWTATGYAAVLAQARTLIEGARETVHVSLWCREAEALAESLRRAGAAGRDVLLFSFTRLPELPGRTLSYGIVEADLERHWPHRLVLLVDRRSALVGGAGGSEDDQALVSEDPALVETAVSNLVLDITLYGRRFGVDTAALVGGLTTRLAPIEELLARGGGAPSGGRDG